MRWLELTNSLLKVTKYDGQVGSYHAIYRIVLVDLPKHSHHCFEQVFVDLRQLSNKLFQFGDFSSLINRTCHDWQEAMIQFFSQKRFWSTRSGLAKNTKRWKLDIYLLTWKFTQILLQNSGNSIDIFNFGKIDFLATIKSLFQVVNDAFVTRQTEDTFGWLKKKKELMSLVSNYQIFTLLWLTL